jgi:hypothetical protein
MTANKIQDELIDALITLWKDTPQPHYSSSIAVKKKYHAAANKMQDAIENALVANLGG